jgi:hypothetical protein
MRCRDCDRYGADTLTLLCADCHEERAELGESVPLSSRRMSRQEQLEGLADQGIDTWEDYNQEK